jgi:hypothetical protein
MKGEFRVNDPMDRMDQAELADRRDATRTPGLAASGFRTVPLPAGCFLIDLPAEACVRFGRQGFNEAGTFIQTLVVPGPEALRALVQARAEALVVPHEEGGTRLEREARRHQGAGIRARERPVGPFPGQELVKGTGPGWLFTWEYLGRPRDPLMPMMLLEMRVSRRPLDGSGEGEIFGLWDAILGSLRRRENFSRYLRLPAHFRSSLSL